MEIEYNTAKNQCNIEARGLSFDEAVDFDFSTANIIEDTRRDYPEQRIVVTGYLRERLHILCFTPIAGVIRVISFRKANKREGKSYESQATD